MYPLFGLSGPAVLISYRDASGCANISDFYEPRHADIGPVDHGRGAWHVPNARTRSLRELLTLPATLVGVHSGVAVLPQALTAILGLFRSDVRELKEMRLSWDHPYFVDATRFSRRFWSDAEHAGTDHATHRLDPTGR